MAYEALAAKPVTNPVDTLRASLSFYCGDGGRHIVRDDCVVVDTGLMFRGMGTGVTAVTKNKYFEATRVQVTDE